MISDRFYFCSTDGVLTFLTQLAEYSLFLSCYLKIFYVLADIESQYHNQKPWGPLALFQFLRVD